MATFSTYDVVIIGSGAAGFSAVESAREQGASVCLIESNRLGGECPNDACVPSKALLKTAAMFRTVQNARAFGIRSGSVEFDFTAFMNYRRAAIKRITGDGEFGDRYVTLLAQMGVETKRGTAQFVDTDLVEVAGEHIRGKAFVIATGTRDFIPPVPGLDRVKYARWKDALRFSRQPKSMAIVGGGPVGCEIATFYASIGTRVVLVQSAPQILHREDPEIAAIAKTALEQLRIEVVTHAQIREVINGGSGVFGLDVEANGEQKMHAVEQLVMATGKRPNTEGLGLEKTSVRVDEHGWIVTNREQQTQQSNIFAAGDIDGGLQFTHTAHHEGVVAGFNAGCVAKKKKLPRRTIQEQVVPRVTFIAPEVASVGMTQQEAMTAHKQVLVGRAQVTELGRAVTDSVDKGMCKLLAHPKTRKVIGAHMISERAGEVIHECALAMYAGITVDKLATMIHAYPTFSEVIVLAASRARLES